MANYFVVSSEDCFWDIFREFAQNFRYFANILIDFAQIFTDFARIFDKSKYFGGALASPEPPPPTPLVENNV